MNQMVDVSESIGNLRSLARLFLNDNRICYFPASMAQLSSLVELDLRANHVKCFADQELLASDNPVIQNALHAAKLNDASEPIISLFSTSLFQTFISWVSGE
jgi:Leucine-rich repeat (LRR) protein